MKPRVHMIACATAYFWYGSSGGSWNVVSEPLPVLVPQFSPYKNKQQIHYRAWEERRLVGWPCTLRFPLLRYVGWLTQFRSGFGAQMANTPMVIMWPNSDGTVTLSPRKAPGEVMPTVDSAPPRTATAQPSSSLLTGSNPKLVFTIPVSSNSGSSIIWAYSSTNPSSSSIDASLVQHLDSGPTTQSSLCDFYFRP